MTEAGAAPEEKDPVLIAPGTAERGDDGWRIVGSTCAPCGVVEFPAQEFCRRCENSMTRQSLGRRGVVYAHTTVHIKPPFGLPKPYSAALIDLEDAPTRIYSLLDPAQSFAIGDRVEAVVGPLGCDEKNRPCLRLYFTKREEGP